MLGKILIFIPALLIASTLFAADPAFDGNMLGALRENDPRIRAGLIIGALENAKDSQCDPTALTILEHDLTDGAFDKTLHLRLALLLRKYPADRKIAFLSAAVARKYNSYPAELSNLLRDFLKKTDLSTFDDRERENIFNLIHAATLDFRKEKKFRESSVFINQLLEKNPHTPALIYAGFLSHIYNMFHTHNTAPELPGFENIPANDFWKSSLSVIGKKLENASIKDQYDARLIILTAIKLDHPQTVCWLKKYSSLYPGNEWSHISTLIAVKYKKTELFIPGNNIFNNFRMYLFMRDFSTARKLIRNMPRHAQDNLNLILKSAQGRHREVVNAVYSGNIKLENLIPEAFYAVANSIHFTKDENTAAKMLKFMTDGNVKHNHIPYDIVACNTAGYIAADLNTGLKDAETLIRKAVNAFPEEAAFRDSLAWVLFRQQRFAEAEKEIMLALINARAELSTAVIFLHAAQIKFSLKKYTESRELLKKAKTLYQPGNPECAEYDIEIQKNLENILK